MIVTLSILSVLSVLILSATVVYIFKPYADYKKIVTYNRVIKVFADFCDYQINIYMTQKAIYDILISNVNIEPDEYSALIQDCSQIILTNTPTELIRLVTRYMNVNQIASFIKLRVDMHFMDVYKTNRFGGE